MRAYFRFARAQHEHLKPDGKVAGIDAGHDIVGKRDSPEGNPSPDLGSRAQRFENENDSEILRTSSQLENPFSDSKNGKPQS